MAQLVVFELEGNNLAQPLKVTLEIADQVNYAHTRLISSLPPAPHVAENYDQWHSVYRCLDLDLRLEADASQITNVAYTQLLNNCYNSTQVLKQSLNEWYRSPNFSRIREKLLEVLNWDEEILVLVRTHNEVLWKLPWHLFFEQFLERYRQAEIVLSVPEYEQVKTNVPASDKIRILAILGNSVGIDVEADRKLLKSLPQAEVQFLVEPRREDLNEQLWAQNWNILFFAGHSSSRGGTGTIYINAQEALTIAEVRYALRESVARGLKLAIFNSCDGLGLAKELSSLNIPQLIIMREPVPDLVAQTFLKFFLKAFANGKSLYLSVREARERLESLENRFPGASWLPVIFQNSTQALMDWQELRLSTPQRSHLIAPLPPVPTPTPIPKSAKSLGKQRQKTPSTRVSKPSKQRQFPVRYKALLLGLGARGLVGAGVLWQQRGGLERLMVVPMTYKNADYGMQITYPGNWELSTETSDFLVGTVARLTPKSVAATGDYAEITIQVVKLQQPLMLAEYTNNSVAQIIEFFPGAKIINSEPGTLGEQPAHQLVYIGQDEERQVTLKASQIWTIQNDRAYVITYIADETIYDRFVQNFQRMLESLMFV